MAGARFLEILRCNGVDQSVSPTGVVVPAGGENQVVLETDGMDLQFQPGVIVLQEFEGLELSRQLLQGVQAALNEPGVDPQQKAAFMPTNGWRRPRFFRVRGTITTGFPGKTVHVSSRVHGRTVPNAAALQVAIVDRIVVKVAIRHVRARDAHGTMRYHANRPCDPVKVVADMNAIWTPQTNIAFELVSSLNVDVDDKDPKTQEELGRAYGLKGAATFAAESTVWADKASGWFAKHRVPGTHMTFFVVHKIHSGGDPVYGRGGDTPNGTTNRPLGVSFIADTRLPSTFAHEAGHFVGDMGHDGTDISLLMRGDGAGYKIPFALAKRFREAIGKRKLV